MKIKVPLTLAGIFMASVLQAATLIQYNFDQQINSMQYADQSGNERTVTFTRDVTLASNYPFSASDPALAGIDKSGRTRYDLTTSASVSKASGINLNTTKQFTMEGWVNLEGFANLPETGVTGGTLWSLSNITTTTSVFALRYTSDGTVQALFNSQSQSGGTRIFDTGVKLTLGTWTHLAYVKTALAVEVYINGVKVSTFSESGITSRTLPTSLTNISVAGNIYGYFDDFRLSNTALTALQLGYNTPFTTIPEPSTYALLLTSMVTGCALLKRGRKNQAMP
jgi:hypothetical protein